MQPIILLPLDGSERAEAILPAAVRMAEATACSVRILHVLTLECRPGTVPAPDRAWGEKQAQAQIYLEGVATRLRRAGVSVDVEIRHGHAATRIVEAARQDPLVSTIAMTAHGRGAPSRGVFGRITEEVLRNAAVPVLLLRDPQPGAAALAAGCTILVPLDGSAFARRALGEAERLGRALRARLLLVAVVPGPEGAMSDARRLPSWLDAAREREVTRLTFELESTARELELHGISVGIQVLRGVAGEALPALAGSAGAALIVMATHGRSGIDRMRWGSVALDVLRATPVPVVLLGPQQWTSVADQGWRVATSQIRSGVN